LLLIDNNRSGDITISQFTNEKLDDVIVESTSNDIFTLFIDVETTGLSYDNDKIIQLACRPVLFDKTTGKITRLAGSRTFYNDPGFEISDEITALTGVSNTQVKEQSVDWEWLAKIMAKVDFVIAHNVRFDRHFVKKHMIDADIIIPDTIWACSMSQIDWRQTCTAGRSLETLAVFHGFYYAAHDATADINALIYLLAISNRAAELFSVAAKSEYRVFAVKIPYGHNDELKSRSYKWDPDVKMWWCGFNNEDDAEAENRWMQERFKIEPQIFEVKPCHLFD
jgi:DNA polymerase-3 subunit epsilon